MYLYAKYFSYSDEQYTDGEKHVQQI